MKNLVVYCYAEIFIGTVHEIRRTKDEKIIVRMNIALAYQRYAEAK